ncbi:DUF4863 family protein [Streptomyces sp. ID-01-6.2a]|uniref:DUF4863 family protein n=1 Tax=Streptomyces caniscabiei TaxID=2746961 RepID=A0A927QIG4_9ACTN|nr:DUF4863 family protein [Streptomyces caniscabiei]
MSAAPPAGAAGKELEAWLNATYGPDSEFYRDLARLIRIGVLEEGWAADVEVDGPRYRCSRLAEPTAETHYFSITAVYMNSVERYRGQYHAHPYGELNLVVPVDPGDTLVGPSGRPPGDPGRRHGARALSGPPGPADRRAPSGPGGGRREGRPTAPPGTPSAHRSGRPHRRGPRHLNRRPIAAGVDGGAGGVRSAVR